jgi:hypothetical protein
MMAPAESKAMSKAMSKSDRVPAGEPFTHWRESDGHFLGYLNAYPDHWTQGDDLEDLKVHRNSQGRLACRGLKRTDLISNWSKLAAFCSAMADGMTSFTSHGLDVPSRCRGIVSKRFCRSLKRSFMTGRGEPVCG